MDILLSKTLDAISARGLDGMPVEELWNDVSLMVNEDYELKSCVPLIDRHVQSFLWARLVRHLNITVRRVTKFLKIPISDKTKTEWGLLRSEKESLDVEALATLTYSTALGKNIVLVASLRARLKFLGLSERVLASPLMSPLRYCILEALGTARGKGLHQVQFLKPLNIKARDLFQEIKQLKKLRIIYLEESFTDTKNENSQSSRRMRTNIIYLAKFSPVSWRLDTVIRHQERSEKSRLDKLLNSKVVPAVIQQLKEVGSYVSDVKARAVYRKLTKGWKGTEEANFRWEQVRDALISDRFGVTQALMNEKGEKIEQSKSAQRGFDLSNARFDNRDDQPREGNQRQNQDEDVALESGKAYRQTYLRQIYQMIQCSGTAGVTSTEITSTMKLSYKMVHKYITMLVSRGVVVNIQERIGKVLGYRYLSRANYHLKQQNINVPREPYMASSRNRSVEIPPSPSPGIMSAVGIRLEPLKISKGFRSTKVYQNRLKWAQELVETDKVVLGLAVRKEIAIKEGSTMEQLDKVTAKRLFRDMEKEGLLTIHKIEIPSRKGKDTSSVVVLLHPSVKMSDAIYRQAMDIAQESRRLRSQGYRLNKDRESFPLNMTRAKAVISTVFRTFCGYVKGKIVSAYLLHKHLLKLAWSKKLDSKGDHKAETPKVIAKLTWVDAIENMPFSLYLQICGAPTEMKREVIFDKSLHSVSINSLLPEHRNVILDRGYEGFYTAYHCLRKLKLLRGASMNPGEQLAIPLPPQNNTKFLPPSIPALSIVKTSNSTNPPALLTSTVANLPSSLLPLPNPNFNQQMQVSSTTSTTVPSLVLHHDKLKEFGSNDKKQRDVALVHCIEIFGEGYVEEGSEQITFNDIKDVDKFWAALRNSVTTANYHRKELNRYPQEQIPELYLDGNWTYIPSITTEKAKKYLERSQPNIYLTSKELVSIAKEIGQSANVLAVTFCLKLQDFAKTLGETTSFMNKHYMKHYRKNRKKEGRKRRRPTVPKPESSERRRPIVSFDMGASLSTSGKRQRSMGHDSENFTKTGTVRKRLPRNRDGWALHKDAQLFIKYKNWRESLANGENLELSFVKEAKASLGKAEKQISKEMNRFNNSLSAQRNLKRILTHHPPFTGLAYHKIFRPEEKFDGSESPDVLAAFNLLRMNYFLPDGLYDANLARKTISKLHHSVLDRAIQLLQSCRYLAQNKDTDNAQQIHRTHKLHKDITEALQVVTYKHDIFKKAFDFRQKNSPKIVSQASEGSNDRQRSSQLVTNEVEIDEDEEEDEDDERPEISVATREPGSLAAFIALAIQGKIEVKTLPESGLSSENIASKNQTAQCGALEASVRAYTRPATGPNDEIFKSLSGEIILPESSKKKSIEIQPKFSQTIMNFIASKGEKGATIEQAIAHVKVDEKFGSTSAELYLKAKTMTENAIEMFEKDGELYRVGGRRIVAKLHGTKWSLPDGKGSRVVPSPWLMLSDGGNVKVNSMLLTEIKQAILSLVARFPGISMQEVKYRFDFLEEHEFNKLIQYLEDEKRLARRNLRYEEPSLFSTTTSLFGIYREEVRLFPSLVTI
mmetsp:Transcript_20652/g.30902  ORF Transcript_20652/g.30902 Transcript_20652/m.30902 type:complete len:1559 (+) Transcript_20652:82-4758(+)